jgi:hypothetical protein
VRVDEVADAGTVKIALAFDQWKAGKVAPATFELPLPPKAEPGKK